MTVVFNRPMLAGGLCKSLATQIVAQEIVTNLLGDLIACLTTTNRHPNGFNGGPILKHTFPAGNRSGIVVAVDLTVALDFASVVAMTAPVDQSLFLQ